MLLFNAAELTKGAEAEGYHETAQTWLEQTCRTLDNSPEKNFSRILIILAQNYGPQHPEHETPTGHVTVSSAGNHSAGRPLLTWAQLAARIIQPIGLGITQFRPARERASLDARMDR